MDKIDTLFDQNGWKPYPLGQQYLYSAYKGVNNPLGKSRSGYLFTIPSRATPKQPPTLPAPFRNYMPKEVDPQLSIAVHIGQYKRM